MKRYILVLLAGVVLTTSAHADISIRRAEAEGLYIVWITNTIIESDYESLVEKVMSKPDSEFAYTLNSRGGSVETALKIGRLLRKGRSSAWVLVDSICYSACVFILAGATSRPAFGRIGIHRPYEPDDISTSAAAQKTKYIKLGNLVRAYLSEMNVKPQLYDDMLYISPENIRMLSRKDLDSYGLTIEDPFEDEANSVKNAKELGISRQEYAKREARLKARQRVCRSEHELAERRGEEAGYGSLAWDKAKKCYDDVREGRR
jgi:hypothetical protein